MIFGRRLGRRRRTRPVLPRVGISGVIFPTGQAELRTARWEDENARCSGRLSPPEAQGDQHGTLGVRTWTAVAGASICLAAGIRGTTRLAVPGERGEVDGRGIR
jgi:hypothetical protein